LIFAGLTDVPGGVREKAVRQVAPARDGQHFEYRNIGAVRFDEIEIRAGGFWLDNDGLELGQIARVLQLIVKIFDGDAEAVGYGGEILFDELGIVAEKQDGERRTIVDQHTAITVEHAAARSDDGMERTRFCSAIWPYLSLSMTWSFQKPSSKTPIMPTMM
jgi:hypothetical protein